MLHLSGVFEAAFQAREKEPPFFFHRRARAAATATVPPAAMYMFVRSAGSSSRLGSALEGKVALSASCCLLVFGRRG